MYKFLKKSEYQWVAPGFCFFLCLLLLSTSGMAAEDKAGKALQRSQQKNQMLEQEKNQLLADKTQMQEELKKSQDAASRLKSSTAKLGATQKELAALQEDQQRISQELTALKSQFAVLKRQHADSVADAQLQRADLSFSQQNLTSKSRVLVSCEDSNRALYELNTDLLSRYEQAYKSAYLLRGGVFTQLGLVNLENEAQEQRMKLRSLLSK